ncbi:MAG TPA: hypothetical protein VFG04_29105 [Planctomycetaceae bacterium]|jgi:hypothetical protein|nr:hypothetical protein [Planctomycetaceae bacterium]
MPSSCRSRAGVLVLAAIAAGLAFGAPSAVRAASDEGFSTVISPSFTGEELRYQQDLWALEVSIKPMRMVYVPVTNPKSGAKSNEMVWYLVYKIVNRPVVPPAAADTEPVNIEDAPPPRIFSPRATLVLEDRDLHGAVNDSIVPEALQAIVARERLDLKTSVQITGPLPKVTPADAKKENVEYGVFMFRGVDPRTTAFSVYLSGFSNAYKLSKSEPPTILRRTIVIPYRRPADEYDQFEKEIRQSGPARWIYVPDEAVVKSEPTKK